MRTWLWALLAGCLGSAAIARPATVEDYMALPRVEPQARIAYGAEPAQVAELFQPQGKGPHPVVILIHGGCYLAEYQGLAQTSGLAADLARRGYAVWNVEYRKLGEPGAGYPGTFLDVAAALDHLRTEASRHDLDLKRVVAVGHSAGGHLALWAAARHRLPAGGPLASPDPLRISAVVSLGGIGDLRPHAGVFAGACGPSIAQVAPPDTYAETSPGELLPGGVRVTMIHGEFDHVMPFDTGEAYAAKAADAGDTARAIRIEDASHFDVVIPTSRAWREVVAPAIVAEMERLR
ncbi:MAG: alpha/beta hydrolase [Phenylobacterium sp.]|nr:alpha/beta hydrolase [Phenylobacterium sp.]